MLVGTYLNLMVNLITSGVFSGMGRPIIATVLSMGFELPVSIAGVAIVILVLKGNLLGVYWWQAIAGALEVVVVLVLLFRSKWQHWADEALRRQEARPVSEEPAQEENDNDNDEEEPADVEDPPSGLNEPLLSPSSLNEEQVEA